MQYPSRSGGALGVVIGVLSLAVACVQPRGSGLGKTATDAGSVNPVGDTSPQMPGADARADVGSVVPSLDASATTEDTQLRQDLPAVDRPKSEVAPVDVAPPVDMAPIKEDAPVAMLLMKNPVPANASTMKCTIPGITTVAQFENVFFREMGVTKKRNCGNSECHNGNYPPTLVGAAGLAAFKASPAGFHCAGLGMKLIDLDRPEQSVMLWRLFMTEKVVRCSSEDGDDMRRMPVIVGQQDSGGSPTSVAARLTQQELECAAWYVFELARQAKAAK